MSNYTTHTCRDTDEMGDSFRPDMATCGSCHRSWCFACHPTPASLCPWCCASGAGDAAIPPRQARVLNLRPGQPGALAPLEPWQRR